MTAIKIVNSLAIGTKVVVHLSDRRLIKWSIDSLETNRLILGHLDGVESTVKYKGEEVHIYPRGWNVTHGWFHGWEY